MTGPSLATIAPTIDARRRRAVWLAVLAVLALLVQPLFADRAQASTGRIASAMTMAMPAPGARGSATEGVATPCHHDGRAGCPIACALSAELLPPAAAVATPPFGGAANARFAWLLVPPSQGRPDSDTPPPR